MKFLRRLRSRTVAPLARGPEGERVYVIGDIHGRADLLDVLLATIADEVAEHGAGKTSYVFLGDLIDRGPESARVIDIVRGLHARGEARVIKGNHEEVFVRAANGDAKAANALLKIGGLPTLLSYGVSAQETEAGSFADLAELLVERIPRADVDFLDQAEDVIRIGDYLLVHAGIRPDIPIEEQSIEDLRWIRTPFLTSRQNHGAIVVHGHTISHKVEVRANRIGLDTGAYMSGVLTAMAIDGTDRWFLDTSDASTETPAVATP